jgi:hypothetical protein
MKTPVQVPLSVWTVLGQHAAWVARLEQPDSIRIRILESRGVGLFLSMLEAGRGPAFAPSVSKMGPAIRSALQMRTDAIKVSNKLAVAGLHAESRSANQIANVLEGNLQRYWRLFAAELASNLPGVMSWSWWRASKCPEFDENGVCLPVDRDYVREWALATEGICTVLADPDSWKPIKPDIQSTSRKDRDERDNQLYILREAFGSLDSTFAEAKKQGITCSRSMIDRAWHRVREDPDRARSLSPERVLFAGDEMKQGNLTLVGRTANQRVRVAKRRVSR